MVAAPSLLAIQLRTRFLLADTGRIERENDPDHSPGPRLWLAGCASGNVVGVHSDVADGVAAEVAAGEALVEIGRSYNVSHSTISRL